LGDCFGKNAKRSAWRMLKKGLVHVVASDAHDVRAATTADNAWKALTQRWDQSSRAASDRKSGGDSEGAPIRR